jgi:hypothetical protein
MECRHRFPNGKRCRCRATADHVFCQHHAPHPPVPTLRNREVPFSNWLDLRRALPTLERAEIPPAILYVLSALLEEHPRPISDRSAGVLLRDLLRRFGSVPFTLPDDPAPEPDVAYSLWQSVDHLTQILHRRSANLSARIANRAPQPPPAPIPAPLPCAKPVQSTAIPHYKQGSKRNARRKRR